MVFFFFFFKLCSAKIEKFRKSVNYWLQQGQFMELQRQAKLIYKKQSNKKKKVEIRHISKK